MMTDAKSSSLWIVFFKDNHRSLQPGFNYNGLMILFLMNHDACYKDHMESYASQCTSVYIVYIMYR